MDNIKHEKGHVGGHIPSETPDIPEKIEFDKEKQLFYITGKTREVITVQAPYTTSPASFSEFSYPRNAIWNVLSQGQTGACVAYALAGALEAMHYRGTGQMATFSSQWIYGNRTGFRWQGEGMYSLETIQRLVRDGTMILRDPILDSRWDTSLPQELRDCMRELYYNDPHDYNIGTELTAKYLVSTTYNLLLPYAQQYKPISYHNISASDVTSIKNAIVGISPVYFSTDVPNVDYCMYATKTGILDRNHIAGEAYTNIWGEADTLRDGSHAMIITGWKVIDGVEYYKIKNSWGFRGDGGYIYFPVSLFGSICNELYCLRANTSSNMLNFSKNELSYSIYEFYGSYLSNYAPGKKTPRIFLSDVFNNLSHYINKRRELIGLPSIAVTIVKKGHPVTAQQFNILKNGFNEYTQKTKNITAINIADKRPGDKIVGSDIWTFFDAIENNL